MLFGPDPIPSRGCNYDLLFMTSGMVRQGQQHMYESNTSLVPDSGTKRRRLGPSRGWQLEGSPRARHGRSGGTAPQAPPGSLLGTAPGIAPVAQQGPTPRNAK